MDPRRSTPRYIIIKTARLLKQGVKLIFIRDHIDLVDAFKGLNIILGLYKYNYCLTRGKDLGAAAE